MPRLPLPSLTLKRFIFFATLIISAVTFLIVIVFTSWIYLKQTQSASAHLSGILANRIYGSIFQGMREGRTHQEMATMLESYQRTAPDHFVMELVVGEKLKRLAASDLKQDEDIRKVFSEGAEFHDQTLNRFQHFYPFTIESKCLACHRGARVGEVLGILSITEDFSATRDVIVYKSLLTFAFLMPFPCLMSFLVARFVNKRIGTAIDLLGEKVHSVTTVTDLTTVQFQDGNLMFRELDAIFGEFGNLVSRIRDVAVGKEMLEFEIRVLERFIITSDVIRDWKERVRYLITEVNKVMQVYAIFCVFMIDEEAYDIEVFWLDPPSTATEALMNEIIHDRVVREKPQLNTVKVNSNIANAQGAVLELDSHEIEFQTKSFFLDKPQIGGVVGVGVQSQEACDPIRSLVIGGILTTLLNVVGSIKAIYKYTKDLEYYATRDPLTNLFNQRVFWELLYYEIRRAERHGYSFGILMIDLDNFKLVNDTYGHIVGDKFLGQAAENIRECLRLGDILARYGGDEFVVALPEAGEDLVYAVGERIRLALENMIVTTTEGVKVRGTASIGIAVFPHHAKTPKDLFMFADNMAYKAKKHGKNCTMAPESDDFVEVFKRHNEMSAILLHALEEKRIIPYFQPIISTRGDGVVCHEVLSRIIVDDSVIEANEFIEIAENLQVVSKLDGILMEQVFAKVRNEEYDGYLFINLSPRSLIIKEFVPMIIRLAREYQINHDKVVFEITERDTLKNMTLLTSFVMSLKLEGFKFAIDDFGSGFSSFQYIRTLPVDFVKIDGMFVQNMLSDAKDMSFVKTLALLAKEFGIQSIAEYVESEETLNTITALGIDFAQGFYTGRPGPDLYSGKKQ